ncbi:hypothetical protein [Winogradskyella sp. PG-2]|uniref:hypothetical protein n=1 Tax=Winogradskyella sp. PG-2 TaxID=754409 RepID=UPI0004587973|nr:hypothetical protein [Winogradskyella sp. PG-2]BAO76880.1 hypothetical protein WPG_2650 [Winogradskyella sp. PG-2]
MKKITTLSLMLLLTSIFINAQTTITVDNSTGADADHGDLQSAINSAANGDILYVHASENTYGDIIIDKPLTIVGFSHSDADKETMIDEVNLLDNASNVKLTGIHFTNDIDINNDSTMITDLIIENNFFDNGSEIYFGGDALVSNMIIRGNVLDQIGTNSASWTKYTNAIISQNIIKDDINVFYHDFVTIENNIFLNGAFVTNVDDDTGDLEVEDSIFFTSSNSIFNPNRDGVVFQNCLSYNDLNGVIDLSGTNNINDTNPLFVSADDDEFDALEDDYNLQAGSPALGTGVAGDDIGIYSTNSAFVFNNFGFTAGIPTVTITAITSQVAPGGNVEVTIQSNSN